MKGIQEIKFLGNVLYSLEMYFLDQKVQFKKFGVKRVISNIVY